MVKTYSDSSIIGVTGPAFPLWKDKYMMWLPEEFFFLISCTGWCECTEIKEVRNVWTENASFRREAFDVAGLFATEIGPKGGSMEGRKREISEDVEVSLRIRKKTKKKIVLNPNVKILHKVYRYRLDFRNIMKWSFWLGLSKYKLKTIYQFQERNKSDFLDSEHQLLRRILTKLVPNSLIGLFKKPALSFRKLSISTIILCFIGLGYLSGFLFSRRK